MAEQRIVTCDICGVVKKETNHWWAVVRVNTPRENRRFTVYPWANFDPSAGDRWDLCGSACLHGALTAFEEDER